MLPNLTVMTAAAIIHEVNFNMFNIKKMKEKSTLLYSGVEVASMIKHVATTQTYNKCYLYFNTSIGYIYQLARRQDHLSFKQSTQIAYFYPLPIT